MTDSWIAEVAAELGIGTELVDEAPLLGLARDVAHGVERKAAPLSTFVVGYAAGMSGADSTGIAELIERVRAMCPPGVDPSA